MWKEGRNRRSGAQETDLGLRFKIHYPTKPLKTLDIDEIMRGECRVRRDDS